MKFPLKEMKKDFIILSWCCLGDGGSGMHLGWTFSRGVFILPCTVVYKPQSCPFPSHRITKSQNSRDHLVPLLKQVPYSRSCRKASGLVLNIFREGDSISPSCLFQCFITLIVKEFFDFVWNLLCSSFCLLLLVLLFTTEKSPSQSTWLPCFGYL